MLDRLGGSWLRCYTDPRIDSSHLPFFALLWPEVEECRILEMDFSYVSRSRLRVLMVTNHFMPSGTAPGNA